MGRIAELAAVTLALALTACAAAPRPCPTAVACEGGVCHAGRCGAVDDVPVSVGARRVVLEAVATRASDDDARFAPTLGGAGASPTLVVRFAPAWGRGRVERAFLVLSPAPGALATPARTTITVARALEPWSVTSAPPRVGPVEATATVTFAPPRAIRIDVTDAVREWARTGEAHHGFVIRASGDDARGASFAIEAGEAPRLDVYVATDKPR